MSKDTTQDEIDAMNVIIEEKKATTGLLQRRLSWTHKKASDILERLTVRGYVQPPDGAKIRRPLTRFLT